MELLRTAVVDITTLVSTCHALTSDPVEGDMAISPKLRKRLRREIKRGTVAYIDTLARARRGVVDAALLAVCRVAAEQHMVRALGHQALLSRVLSSQPGALQGVAAARQGLWRLAHMAIYLRLGVAALRDSGAWADVEPEQKAAASLRRRLRKALIAYARSTLRTGGAVPGGGSCWGGGRCAPTPLRCSVRGRAAELATFATLTALKQPRRVSRQRALRAPTPALRFSSPQKSPPPGTAWREARFLVFATKTNAVSAKACPGRLQRASEGPRSAGLAAVRAAPTAEAKRCGLPGHAFAARTLACKADVERPHRVCAVIRRRFPAGANPARQPLQPEATGADMEVTKCLKPSGKRATNWWQRECAGRNASER